MSTPRIPRLNVQPLQSSRSWSSTLIGVGRGVCVTPRMPLMESSPRPQGGPLPEQFPFGSDASGGLWKGPDPRRSRSRYDGSAAGETYRRRATSSSLTRMRFARRRFGLCVLLKERTGPSACRNRERVRAHRHWEGLAPGPCGGSYPLQLDVNGDLHLCLRPQGDTIPKGSETFARPQRAPGPGL
jgi:hypothetical protein